MCSVRKNFSPKSEVLSFTYPKLHCTKTWYVDFFALDPATGEMRRKKYHLDSIPKKSDRRKRASELMEALLKQLRSGWNPWVNAEDNRGYILLDHALKKYEASLEKLPKLKTRQSYGSKLNVLREYISLQLLPPKYVYQYTTSFITDFLDWLYLDREVSGRTRNNYRGWCSSLAAYFIEREYISSNPVEKIRAVAEEEKKRQPLTSAMLSQLATYLKAKNPLFYLACMMEYYTMIRPEELSNVRICDISLKEQSVFIPASVSKNKRDGKVGLNDDIARLMIDLGIFSNDGDCYIFGDKLRTCKKKASGEIFRRQWLKVRKALKWGSEYQFYSLKDSGIRDLANAEGIVIARDQARHTDISTTNKYLKGRDLPIHDATKHFKGGL
ncbi:MAG: tyrosine-type recombinase/integrase [Muribaculaceae bacterium]|nr:tyrosine-type recombinase/integrase [Muribaculaceae bacterium]